MGKKRIITTQGDAVNTTDQSAVSAAKKTIKKQVLEEFDATAQEVDKEMGKLIKDLKEIKAVV